MSDLLPLNATDQERALSDATARVGEVPVPVREIWNAETCPPGLLAYLAFAFSVDEWDGTWTDDQKRGIIRTSVDVHRHKGTIGAVRNALAALQFDAQVQEWFAQSPAGDPYTFRVLLNVDQVGVSQQQYAGVFAIIERTKNLRSHLSEVQLNVTSVAGPYVAVVAGIGSEITLNNYIPAFMIVNETTFIL